MKLHNILVQNSSIQHFPVSLEGLKCRCCCDQHCRVNFHNIYGSKVYSQRLSSLQGFQLGINHLGNSFEEVNEMSEVEENEMDTITTLIMGVGVSFS